MRDRSSSTDGLRLGRSVRRKGLAQELRIVRDDAIDAQLGEPPHIVGGIDRPDHYFLSRSLDLADQLRVHQRLLRDHILDRQFSPIAELGLGLANQTERYRRILHTQRLQHPGNERRDDESPARFVPKKQIERYSLQAFDLEFNVEERIAVALQNITQARQ